VLLDVVRGFTLYGVLLANTVPYFSGRAFLPKSEAFADLGTADHVALFFLTVFISRKSQTLLTCLFGLGFAIQLGRAEARGQSASLLYLRRLAVLFFIGVCHVGQVVIARAWLKRFRWGPMEWVWRWLTYGTAPRMH